MNRLVANLLNMVRLESGMLTLNRQWCVLEDILGVALARTREAMHEHQVKVRIDSDFPPIYVDEILMEQLCVNLLSNALKYSPTGSKVSVFAEWVGQTARMSVSDEGPGVVESDLEKIFTKFYRALPTRHVPGTGLGLAICKGIVEAHGGVVYAVNRSPRGLTIYLELLERLREFLTTPIVVLSVKEHETVKIRALDLGADDYVTKPFSSGELMARIRVALRHRQPLPEADHPCLQFGRLMVNLALRTVEVNGHPVHLTPLEYDLLRTLVLHAGRVLTHRQLIQAVWGSSYSQTDGQYLRVHIANLRKKIEEDVTQPTLLRTEPGIGYRFMAVEDSSNKDCF